MKKITKILSLGILFLFVFSLQLSAQKCRYDYDKKDPISGEETKGSSFAVSSFMGMANWKMGVNKIGNTYYIGNLLNVSGNVREMIKKGETVVFKLSNGEIVTLYAQDDFLPVQQATQNGVYTQFTSKYNIDAETLQKMAENMPTFIRLNAESKVYEKEIPAKLGKQISQAAKCILQ
jgi:hypothetical protein